MHFHKAILPVALGLLAGPASAQQNPFSGFSDENFVGWPPDIIRYNDNECALASPILKKPVDIKSARFQPGAICKFFSDFECQTAVEATYDENGNAPVINGPISSVLCGPAQPAN